MTQQYPHRPPSYGEPPQWAPRPQDYYPPPPASPTKRRAWPWIVGVIVLLLVIVGLSGGNTSSTSAPTSPTGNGAAAPAPARAAPQAPAAPPPPAAPQPPAASGPATRITSTDSAFGGATYEVGTDIAPGRYRTTGPTSGDSCYWARLKNTDGDLQSIIANGNAGGPTTVTIATSDTAFEVRGGGCTWTKVG